MSSTHFRVVEHVVPGQHIREYPAATSGDQNAVLEICVKQYVPLEWAKTPPPDDAVTIIGAHANGMPKELYEPLWDDILRMSRGKFHIRGIWIPDVMNQGDSYMRNESVLGDDPSWYDSSRDLLQIINHFRREMPRPIVGIGHSFGAAYLVNLALFHARLFSSLILIDPVITALSPDTRVPGLSNPWGVIYLSAHRRDLWPSRAAAKESLSRNPFYKSWDSRVFDKYIDYGLIEIPTAIYPDIDVARRAADKAAAREGRGSSKSDDNRSSAELSDANPLTLKTSKHQEVMTFLRPNLYAVDENGQPKDLPRTHPDAMVGGSPDYPFYRPEMKSTFRRLPSLRPPTYWVFGAQSSITGADRHDRVMLTGIGLGGNGGEARHQDGTVPGLAGLGTKHVVVPKTGHLVPLEAPTRTAELCVEWLDEVIGRWKEDERDYKDEMSRRGMKDHLTLNAMWEKGLLSGKPDEKSGLWKLKL